MKNTPLKTIVLLIVLIILGVLTYKVSTKKEEIRKSYSRMGKLFNVKKEDIVKIHIKNKWEDVWLEKKNGKWLVSSSLDYPADKDVINDVLENIVDMKYQTIVSENPENFKVFNLDDKNKNKDEVYFYTKNGKEFGFWIGKNGPGFTSNYVRKKDGKKIYLIGKYIGSIFDRGGRTWRDTSIIEFPPLDVSEIKIHTKDYDISLIAEKNKDNKITWKFKNNKYKKVKQDLVKNLINKFKSLKADAFWVEKEFEKIKDKEKNEKNKKKLSEKDIWKKVLENKDKVLKKFTENYKYTFVLNDGSKYEILIGKKYGDSYFIAKVPEKDTLFLIRTWKLNDIINKKGDDFIEKEKKMKVSDKSKKEENKRIKSKKEKEKKSKKVKKKSKKISSK